MPDSFDLDRAAHMLCGASLRSRHLPTQLESPLFESLLAYSYLPELVSKLRRSGSPLTLSALDAAVSDFVEAFLRIFISSGLTEPEKNERMRVAIRDIVSRVRGESAS